MDRPDMGLLLAALVGSALESEQGSDNEQRQEAPANVPHYATEAEALTFAAKLMRAAPGDIIVCARLKSEQDIIGVLCGAPKEGRFEMLVYDDDHTLALFKGSAALVKAVISFEDYLATKRSVA